MCVLYDDLVLLVLDELNLVLDVEGFEVFNKVVCSFKLMDCIVIIMMYCFMVIVECDWLVVIDVGCIKVDGLCDEVL